MFKIQNHFFRSSTGNSTNTNSPLVPCICKIYYDFFLTIMFYRVKSIYYFIWYCVISFQFYVKCPKNLLVDDYLKISGQNILNKFVPNKLQPTMNILINLVDINKDTLISIDELRFWFFHLATKSTERYIKSEFFLLDANQDSFVEFKEFDIYRVNKYLLINASQDVTQELFNQADENKDKKLTFDEAKKIILQCARSHKEIELFSESLIQSVHSESLLVFDIFKKLTYYLKEIDDDFLKWAVDDTWIFQIMDKDQNKQLDEKELANLFQADIEQRTTIPILTPDAFTESLLNNLRSTFKTLNTTGVLSRKFIDLNLESFASSAFTYYGEVFTDISELKWIVSQFNSSSATHQMDLIYNECSSTEFLNSLYNKKNPFLTPVNED